jgi:predicted RecB family nuclease
MHRLSKSRFVAGWQCPKLLWWKVHEPNAPELQPDKVLQDRFDQGEEVGRLARQQFPGGVLIDLPHNAVEERLAATRAAMDAEAPAIFEATFLLGDVFVAVDVLLRTDAGYTLIEVKSSSSVKDEHIPDAAIQTWVLRQSGVAVAAVEIMHLNKEFRHPALGPLFVRADVTERVAAFLPSVPGLVEEQLEMIAGPLPKRAIGIQCYEPRDCAFRGRCWPNDPEHISTLYLCGPKTTASYLHSGVHRIPDIPAGTKLSATAQRQIRSLKAGELVVEPGLAKALEPFESPLGFLDFETVGRAIPVWEGLSPWMPAIAQFSYHEEQPDGTYRHVGWLAEGPDDPRRGLAERMIAATAGARRIVTYSAYEKTRIKELQALVPDLADPLEELLGKLVDLLPVVRNNVYHPDFRGSFSLKYILTPLVPELTYSDLVIVDGLLASVEIARLLFVAHKIPPAERDRLRQDLLAYCERDTWATVCLLRRLQGLSVGLGPHRLT